jgi:flagellar biosynthesis protein FlhF
MRLKSFHAKSMSEAMRQVRAVLGEEAIIVTTKEERNGWVRITAALEQPETLPEKTIAKQAKGFDEETIVEIITDTLLKHRVPAAVSDKIISASMLVSGNDPKKILTAALQKTFVFGIADKKRKPIVLVGAPGAGKTLMTAKMAARSVLDGHKPAVITTDIARAGGVEQLEAFLNILSVPLLQADDAKELKTVMAGIKNSTQIIIDTGGLNPFDPQEMKQLAKLLQVEEMEAVLVLPAGMDAEESADMAMAFGILGVKKIIPTRLDFARRLGGLLNAADKAGLSFMEASHTSQVANGILTVTPEILANYLMPHTPQKREKK